MSKILLEISVCSFDSGNLNFIRKSLEKRFRIFKNPLEDRKYVVLN